MASIVYNIYKEKVLSPGVNLVTADVRCLLVKSLTTTPDNPDHDFVADIAADEATDASYARKTLSGKTVARNDTANRGEFDFDNIVFPTLSGAAIVGAVLFVHVTNNADSWLISFHDFADTTPDGTDFTLVVGADGGIHAT